MGRGLLILCLGSFIILGMVQHAVQQRQLTMSDGNVKMFMVNHARNAVNSGLELGLNRVFHDSNWEDVTQPWEFPVDTLSVQVWVDTHDDYPNEVPPMFIRVRSEYEIENRPLQAHAFLEFDVITPPVKGAVGFYGADAQANLSGNANIYGYDTNPDQSEGSEDALPAITAETEEDSLVNQSGNATYEGEPDFEQQELDGQELNDLVAMYESQADVYESPADLGTPENPKITVLNEYEKLESNINAAGILIVKEGVTLDLRGDFSFEGLVIVEGELDIRGNVSIYGALMFTDNALLEIDDPDGTEGTFTGNTDIYYSSSGLQNINNKLSHRFEQSGMTVSRIFY
ncbi:MAG: hypothetical protein WD097_08345 [Balneolales bacterium]